MKVAAGRADAFARAPDAKARAILVYGPDTGLVRERMDTLARSVLSDLKDPFRVADLAAAALREDPARLADEAAAMALTGGRRVVRVFDAGDAVTGIFERFLEDPVGDALVLAAAGDLPPRSSLRKLFEAADNAAALPCYADEGQGLEAVVTETLRAEGLEAERDALAFLVDHLGGDRMLTRRELEKLVLYMGGPGKVRLEDVLACVGDSAALSLDDLALSVAEGDQAAVQRILDRLLASGTSPVAVLRAVARHFQRLHLAGGLAAGGKSPEQAMAALKPPVFFRHKGRFAGQLRRWPPRRLAGALDLLLAAETDCKTTGLPANAVCGRALMQIARAAARR